METTNKLTEIHVMKILTNLTKKLENFQFKALNMKVLIVKLSVFVIMKSF